MAKKTMARMVRSRANNALSGSPFDIIERARDHILKDAIGIAGNPNKHPTPQGFTERLFGHGKRVH